MSVHSNIISVIPDAGAGISAQPAPELSVVIPTFNERDNVGQTVKRLQDVLAGHNWEVIFVDDNSPDGTAAEVRSIGQNDQRVRCIRRLGRRGLAGACIEGMLTSQARYIAVMDADLQHDERLLMSMLDRLRGSDVDLVVATRYLNGGNASGFSAGRSHISLWSNVLAQKLLGVDLTDPMSGFFMIRRTIFEALAPKLSATGFKILLDIATSSQEPLRTAELPYEFRDRIHGESKLDTKVALDFALLLYSKITHDIIPYRFWLFCLVGLTGVAVHMFVLQLAIKAGDVSFLSAQIIATICAITSNFYANNALTYRDKRLRGASLWIGLLEFQVVCAVGALSNVGVASLIYSTDRKWWLAGLLGAMIGTVWNFVVSSVFVWRTKQ
jgi:dolichol-phosphate mannosyltransferase